MVRRWDIRVITSPLKLFTYCYLILTWEYLLIAIWCCLLASWLSLYLLIKMCGLIKLSLCSAASLGFLMSLQTGQLSLYTMLCLVFYRIYCSFTSLFHTFLTTSSRYVWILLVVFQLLMANVSLLGHLCGILSGYACKLFKLVSKYVLSNQHASFSE